MGTVSGVSDGGDGWQSVISVRHRNGVTDGSSYGLYLRSNLTSTSANLIWNRNYGTGNWQGERTILDSATTSVSLKNITARDSSSIIGSDTTPFSSAYIKSCTGTRYSSSSATTIADTYYLTPDSLIIREAVQSTTSQVVSVAKYATNGITGSSSDNKKWCYVKDELTLVPVPSESNELITEQVTAHDGCIDLIQHVPSSLAGSDINQHLIINGTGIDGYYFAGTSTTKQSSWSLGSSGFIDSSGYKSIQGKSIDVTGTPDSNGNIWFTGTALEDPGRYSVIFACSVVKIPYPNSPVIALPCRESKSGKYVCGCHLMRASTNQEVLTNSNWGETTVRVYYR